MGLKWPDGVALAVLTTRARATKPVGLVASIVQSMRVRWTTLLSADCQDSLAAMFVNDSVLTSRCYQYRLTYSVDVWQGEQRVASRAVSALPCLLRDKVVQAEKVKLLLTAKC